MAMNKDVLGLALANLIIAGDCSSENRAIIENTWKSIADTIITHIQANALVTVALGIPVATTGSATAQTGATTATGTGTIA